MIDVLMTPNDGKFEVRKALLSDKEALVNIWYGRHVDENGVTIKDVDSDVAATIGRPFIGALVSSIEKGEVHITVYDNVITGFVRYHERRDGWKTIYEIFVLKAYRGFGHGRVLLWSVSAPFRLKVISTNDSAIGFYEKMHMVRTGQEVIRTGTVMYHYELRIMFLQVANSNKRFAETCRAAGIAYGSRHDHKLAAYPVMIDINWKNYDWQKYIELVKTQKPVMAMIPDYESVEQRESMLEKYAQLKEIGILRVMVCPKFDEAIGDIPKDAILAISIPSEYAGYLPPTEQLKGRYLHLLGGSPRKQYDYVKEVMLAGACVISADGNSHERASNFNSVWTFKTKVYKSGIIVQKWGWQRPKIGTIKTDKYGAMLQSAKNIADMFQEIKFERWTK